MYVDADVLYAYLKPSDWLKSFAEKIIKKEMITSSITVVELEIVAKRDFSEDFANQILDELKKLPNIKIVELNKKILEKSVELRKNHGLNIFDAVHAATALIYKKSIISSDLMFERIKELNRIDPREIKN